MFSVLHLLNLMLGACPPHDLSCSPRDILDAAGLGAFDMSFLEIYDEPIVPRCRRYGPGPGVLNPSYAYLLVLELYIRVSCHSGTFLVAGPEIYCAARMRRP